MKHTVKWVKTLEYEEGWGVAWNVIYDEETEQVADIDGEVVLVAPANVKIVGEVPCVRSMEDDNRYYPIQNFKHLDDLTVDDTHDLRDRWFATKDEAEAHYNYTVKRFKNPQPWESFVTVSDPNWVMNVQ